MLRRIFGKKPEPTPVLVLVHLNARLQPLDRGQWFEDPLDAALKERGFGEVSGGGTQQSATGEITGCDIEIQMRDVSPDALSFVVLKIDELGAPRGSSLTRADGSAKVAVGSTEGLAVYLNGTELPDEVYSSCDSNFVKTELGRLMDDEGRVLSHWQGPTETALYAYGRSFETMHARIDAFLARYPLCSKCRVERVA